MDGNVRNYMRPQIMLTPHSSGNTSLLSDLHLMMKSQFSYENRFANVAAIGVDFTSISLRKIYILLFDFGEYFCCDS